MHYSGLYGDFKIKIGSKSYFRFIILLNFENYILFKQKNRHFGIRNFKKKFIKKGRGLGRNDRKKEK